MLPTTSATWVRKTWSSFIDEVIRAKPAFIKRHRDTLALLSMKQLNELLKPYRLSLIVYHEPDGSVTGTIKELELAAHAVTVDEVKAELAKELCAYADEYMKAFEFYYFSQEKSSHFPYVLRIVTLDNCENIIKLMDIQTQD